MLDPWISSIALVNHLVFVYTFPEHLGLGELRIVRISCAKSVSLVNSLFMEHNKL
jgi:hypothetical protein